MKNIIILIITHLFVINVSNQAVPLPPGSHEFFITEIVRVKRQAGYVYNTPNIPFELPTQITTVSTQAQNVDRTQAQHMFYAYPAPAVSPSVGTTTGGQTSTAIKNSGNGGYNYGQQSVEASSTQLGTAQNQKAANGQSGSVSSGYGYNTPRNRDDGGKTINSGTVQIPSNSGSTATSTVSSSYRYDTPSSVGHVENKSGSSGSINTNNHQQINSGISSSSTGSPSSGYEYNGPTSTLKTQSLETSVTKADSGTSQSSGAYTSGYNTGTAESSTSGIRSSQTATSSVNSSYRYENPVLSNAGQFFTSSESSQPISGSDTGYNYNNQIQTLSNVGHNNLVSQSVKNTENTQKTTNSDVSGYNINAPNPSVSNIGQTTEGSTATQTSSSSSTATSSVSTSYGYEPPRKTGSNQSFGVSLNAPKYLPPSIEASVEVNNGGSSGTATSNTGKPSGSYLPPLVSGPINPISITSPDKYIPPARNSGTGSNVSCEGPDCSENATSKPSALYTTFPVISTSSDMSRHRSSLSNNNPNNIKQSNSAVIQPYNAYIQPLNSQPSGFVSAQPSSSYVPSAYTGSLQSTVTKPGLSYLLPQGSQEPVELKSTITQPSQSYISQANSAASGYSEGTIAVTPNAQYLPQNTISTGSEGNTAISQQNNNYLPPKQGSSVQQGTVTIPAASYLPPVF